MGVLALTLAAYCFISFVAFGKKKYSIQIFLFLRLGLFFSGYPKGARTQPDDSQPFTATISAQHWITSGSPISCFSDCSHFTWPTLFLPPLLCPCCVIWNRHAYGMESGAEKPSDITQCAIVCFCTCTCQSIHFPQKSVYLQAPTITVE